MGLFSKTEYAGTLKWEEIKNDGVPLNAYRAKIPGGWLYIIGWGVIEISGSTFIPDPDPEYKWDGNSVD